MHFFVTHMQFLFRSLFFCLRNIRECTFGSKAIAIVLPFFPQREFPGNKTRFVTSDDDEKRYEKGKKTFFPLSALTTPKRTNVVS